MKRAFQILGVLLLCLTSLLADPGGTSAIATAIGEVLLNGSALVRSRAIFEGDHLTTGGSAVLVLHVVGSSIRVGPGSEVLFRGKTLDLVSGTTEIRGTENVITRATSISPIVEAEFTVRHQGVLTSLRLTSGSLKILRGKDVRTISAPGEYRFQDDTPVPPVKSHGTVLKVAVATGAGTSTIIAHWLTAQEKSSSAACVSGKSPTSCR